MSRPRKPLIDRNDAVRTALEMIDRDGLASFSIEKLGRQLGVKGPSLYHHFADRADLLARVARLILLEVPDPWDDDADGTDPMTWDERMVQMTLEFRRAMLRHANAGPILLEYFPRALVLDAYERAVTAMEAAEIPDRYHLLIFEGMEKLTLGSALYWGAAGAAARSERATPFPDFSSANYPALNRAVRASEYDDEALFEASCVAFLDGIKERVARERDER